MAIDEQLINHPMYMFISRKSIKFARFMHAFMITLIHKVSNLADFKKCASEYICVCSNFKRDYVTGTCKMVNETWITDK